MPALDTLANICNELDLDSNDILCVGTYKQKENTKVDLKNNTDTQTEVY